MFGDYLWDFVHIVETGWMKEISAVTAEAADLMRI